MDAYLSKPVDLAALAKTLSRWVPRPTPRAGYPPAVDPARLETLRDLGPADGRGLLPAAADAFRRGVPSSMAALQQAVDGGGEGLEEAAHKLKGAAASIGARGAASLCQELEQLGREPGSQPGPELLARLRTELARVDTALENALAARP